MNNPTPTLSAILASLNKALVISVGLLLGFPPEVNRIFSLLDFWKVILLTIPSEVSECHLVTTYCLGGFVFCPTV